MPLSTLALILTSVAMICSGQLLFKAVGQKLQAGYAVTSPGVVLLAGVAVGIYGLATLLWIHVLRTVPLTKAYPFMALSFVAVPLGSIAFFSEHVRPQYVVGTTLIIAGVVITSLSK
jgi:drug/metabolite transporter (DMT)-like permease